MAASEIRRALDRVGASECTFCKGSAWAVAEADFALERIDKGAIARDQAMAVRPLVCERCGFVRLLHIETLLG